MDFESLTEEQKATIKACTSPEEVLALAKSLSQEGGYELSDAELEAISGGSWYDEVGPGDVRDDIDERLVSDAFATGEIRGDGLD